MTTNPIPLFKTFNTVDAYYDALIDDEINKKLPYDKNPGLTDLANCVNTLARAFDKLNDSDWQTFSEEHKNNIVCAGIRYVRHTCNEKGTLDSGMLKKFHDAVATLLTYANHKSEQQCQEFAQLYRLSYDNNLIHRSLDGYLRVLARRNDSPALENLLFLYIQHDSFSGVIDAVLQSNEIFRMNDHQRDMVLKAGLHSLSGPYALEDYDSAYSELVPLIERISTLFTMSGTLDNEQSAQAACIYGRLVNLIDFNPDVKMTELEFAANLIRCTLNKNIGFDLDKYKDVARVTGQLRNISFWRGALTDLNAAPTQEFKLEH